MIERHYDDEALIALLESRREAADTHLPSCPPCSSNLESFRTIGSALRDADVWDKREIRTEAVPATIATLRAFADRMVDDDTKAETILTELLAGERETWMPRLQAHPEWRTAGVVRKLIERLPATLRTMPPDAVAMTAVATDIADNLDEYAVPSVTIHRLRGAAWRERAFALYYTGDFKGAETAIFASESKLSSCLLPEYDLARLRVVDALVCRAFERFDEALVLARESAEVFARFGDAERLAGARLAEAHIYFSLQQFASAEAILRPLARRLVDGSEGDMYARVLVNLAYCVRKLGRFEEAIRHYETAAVLFEDLGVHTEMARLRWNVASTLAEAGRLSDAHERLCAVMPEMERLGMTSEAACMALNIAEVLLAADRYDDVEQICRNAMAIFEKAGVTYTARAMTALAYMKEATAARRATTTLVRDVREYIRRLPAQPSLLFAPSPD